MIETKEKTPEMRVLLSWKAPSRVAVRHGRDWYVTLATVTFLVVLILIFLHMFIEIAVVFSLIFLAYILLTVPPEEIENRITTQGITTAGRTFIWEELRSFWMVDKNSYKVLTVETRFPYPRQVFVVLGTEIKQEDVIYSLTPYLSYREVPEVSFIDKMADWLSRFTF